MNKKLVIVGISTEVGKTIVSAIFTEALKADYWKPVQSGAITDSDKLTVQGLISNNQSVFHPEAYCLKEPLSPHAAADIEGVRICLDEIEIPDTRNNLVIEMAGGLMVPLNDKEFNYDLLKKWNLPVVLVANYYLGSINHTLLSIELLRSSSIPIHSIVFNGNLVQSSRDAILRYANVERYFELPEIPNLDQLSIQKHAGEITARI
tara:strand:+ start:2345 stop:2962 length:618 start_codon:yes stop_codon:yes gene_type:complete